MKGVKRFLVFCLICIVTACLGLLTFRFLTLEETLTVNQTTFEINMGDEVPLEITREHVRGTVPEPVVSDSSIVNYDKVTGKFSALRGGKVTITVSSSVKTIAPISILVTVGDGSEQSPFFIKDAETLAQIGVKTVDENNTEYVMRPLNAYYSLLNDIDLSTYKDGVWTPIGSETEPFTGVLKCNNHIISGLNIEDQTLTYAGLFARIANNSMSTDNILGGLTLTKANISGQYDYSGVLAGSIEGKVRNVIISSSSIKNTKDNACIGLLSGYQSGQAERISLLSSSVEGASANVGGLTGLLTSANSTAMIDRSYAEGVNVKGNLNVGGLIGLNQGGVVVNCYTQSVVENENKRGVVSADSTSARLGGLIGSVEVYNNKKASVVDCYSTNFVEGANINAKGQLIGCSIYAKDGDILTDNNLFGLYYQNQSILGIGARAEGQGVLTTITSRETEKANYEFIYNNLDTETEGERKFESHKTVNGSATKTYYWTIGDVWVLPNVGYPVLDINGPYFDVSSIIGSVVSSTDIDSIEKLIALRNDVNNGTADYSKAYTLVNNIAISSTDWEPIGTAEHPFKGIFTAPLNADGQPAWKITNLIYTVSTGNDGYATAEKQLSGLFGVVSGDAKISNIYIENPSIKKGQYVGALASINYGTIQNCQVVATDTVASIETNNIGSLIDGKKDNTVYVGGLVGKNIGTVDNCLVKGIKITQSNSAQSMTLNMGGIVGENTGVIQNSGLIAVENASNEISTSYDYIQNIGGIAGNNTATITSCYVTVGTNAVYAISAKNNNTSAKIGGLVGVNESNGNISGSFVKAVISGYNVGGIVNINYGNVDQCGSFSEITGKFVGGIAYKISNGLIKNCWSKCSISTNGDSDSIVTGLVYDLDYFKGNALSSQPRMTNSFADCTFILENGNGKAYYDTYWQSRYDGNWPKSRIKGYVINCIYNRDTTATRSYSPYWNIEALDHKDWETPAQIIKSYTSNSKRGYLLDTGITVNELKSEDGAQLFRTYGFDETIWSFGNGNMPYVKSIMASISKLPTANQFETYEI